MLQQITKKQNKLLEKDKRASFIPTLFGVNTIALIHQALTLLSAQPTQLIIKSELPT
jgi:hypothetical protein